jgi:ADP-heptose:LPS heptosyltransferase
MPSNALQRLPPGSRVAIIRLRSLGDCVLTTPAIALLKNFRPDLSISVVVEDRFAPVFDGNPAIDAILPPSKLAIARWRPDLTLNLHGGSSSSQLTFASRAKHRAGFEHFRFRALYTIRVPRAQDILGVDRKVHTAEHLASAMFYLGVPAREIPRATLFASPAPGSPPYAVIHPKASTPEKTWPVENFRAIAEQLQEEWNLEPVFIAGPGESLDEFRPFRCLVGAHLEQVKTLLSGAALFLGNDSGPAHMAAAFGLPVVVLFGASDPVIWAPWKTESVVLTAGAIASIPVSEVLKAFATLSVGQVQ